jgi:hypothetical protein
MGGRCAGIALLSGLLAGCAAVPWPYSDWPRTEAASAGWLDLRGAVHVHTRASHDSPGTIEEVVAAAHATGIAWVALTEHTRPGRQGPWGVIDGVTVLPGFELSAAGASLLALGVAETPPKTKEPAALVRWARDAGGLAFVGHFEHARLADPAAWDAAGPDGVELVNLHANGKLRSAALGWRVPLLPGALALRTLAFVPAENLARWAALPGPPPIVGSVDAHAKFRLFGRLGGSIDRYRDVFRIVTTHVLARDASAPAILDALRSGRSYVALEALGRVDAFRFEPTADGFELEAPEEARLVLVCDGRVAAEAHARRARLAPPPGASSCRAEARRDDALWVLTSPRALPMESR